MHPTFQYTCRMTQGVLTQLIPDVEGDVDSTPVIMGVCAWLRDMGILDGNDDEILKRLDWMATEGKFLKEKGDAEIRRIHG